MKEQNRLRIAVQKSGRLNSDCMDLLLRCGLKVRGNQSSLVWRVENLPIDLLLVRDDDIPTFVMDKVCDIGMVGENVLAEKALSGEVKDLEVIKKLGFCRCRLAIAVPEEQVYQGPISLNQKKIATSYPALLKQYLENAKIKAEIINISGSVEIAPNLGMADAICDLVSSGRTLEENKLKEVEPVLESQALLIKAQESMNAQKQASLELLLRRIDGVLKAQESKYIMFHAPKDALEIIKKLLPGCEAPTIMALEGTDKVAVHAVASEGIFWNTLENLKQAGASSILVLPIEKMMD